MEVVSHVLIAGLHRQARRVALERHSPAGRVAHARDRPKRNQLDAALKDNNTLQSCTLNARETQLDEEANVAIVKALRAQQAALEYLWHNVCGHERTTVCTETTECFQREAEVSTVSKDRTARMNTDDDAHLSRDCRTLLHNIASGKH